MRKTFFKYRFILIPLMVIAFLSLFSFIVMQLWNNVLAEVTAVKMVTWPQALGILILAKILFGGFGPGRRGGPGRWKHHRMWEKMKDMTPEERERFKSEMGRWCGGWEKQSWEKPDQAPTV